MIRLLVGYILTAAIRDRLFLSLMLLVVVGVCLSVFLGSSAITEKDQFSMVFASGGLRIGGLLTLVLFTVFYVRRSFETHDVEYLLSRPMSRLQFLMAHFISLLVLSALMASVMTVVLLLMPSQATAFSCVMWGISIFIEMAIVANVALFFSLMLSSAVAASLISLAFYVLSRLMGGILGIVMEGAGTSMTVILNKVMLAISVFIPRLDLMGQTSWLVYGFDNMADLKLIVLQGSIFLGFVLSVAFWDLKRKQF